MAIVHQGTQRTIKADVYDIIKGKFKPDAAPLFNRMQRGPNPTDATLFQYPADARDNPSNAGSVEGRRYDQANTVTHGNRGQLLGRTQYIKEEFGVGEVSEGNTVEATGGKSEFRYEMDNALLKTIDSCEYTIVGGQESQAGSKTAAFRTRGLERQIVDTGRIAVQTDAATVVPEAFRPAAGQIVALPVTDGDYPLTQANINAPFESIYNVLKAKIDLDVWCTTKFKGKVSDMGMLVPTVTDMTVVRRFNQSAADMKIVATVETFQGDCGLARFDLHPWLRHDPDTQATEAFGLEMTYACLRMRTPPSVKELPDQAAGKEGYTQAQFGLQITPKFQARWLREDAE